MSTDQGAVAVLCSREGNRRSGVALAVRHILCGVWKGDEHPAYTRVRNVAPVTFL